MDTDCYYLTGPGVVVVPAMTLIACQPSTALSVFHTTVTFWIGITTSAKRPKHPISWTPWAGMLSAEPVRRVIAHVSGFVGSDLHKSLVLHRKRVVFLKLREGQTADISP
jgi:hypothetical protein